MEKLTKEKAKELMKLKGETRGTNIKTDWEFVRQEQGEKGLKMLKAKMKEVGCPLDYKKIRATDFYPIGIEVVSMLAIDDLFKIGREGFIRAGAFALGSSVFLKIMMRYFVSLDLALKETPRMWFKHYSIGRVEYPVVDEKEKYVVCRLYDFATHPFQCASFMGFFSKVVEVIKRSEVSAEETKCPHKGDVYHEFIVKWQ